jgi:hypothetical protein
MGALMTIARTPLLGRFLLVIYRAGTAWSYFREPLANLLRLLFASREISNFTYDLEQTNEKHLASAIADITGKSYDAVMSFIREIKADDELRSHISVLTRESDLAFIADSQARFGRRIGWYALARILKPRVIIETGVDKGLGACLLTAALRRNAREGHPGRYFGTDLNPKAGYLLSGDYASYGTILYGDSIASLKNFAGTIDLFINDSDHSPDYEAGEYRAIADKLSRQAVILGDNAHCTDKLLEFSLERGRHFVFFREKPARHWYPGAGIGFSFNR